MKISLHSKILSLLLVSTLFTACGYAPSSKFARKAVGEKISTSIVISAQDPENTVIIKDAVDAAIIEVFHAALTSHALSDTHLILSLARPSYAPIEYDVNGFIIGYRAAIVLHITEQKNGKSKKYTVRGTYDFSISPNAIITDQERFFAIKYSSEKAIKSFIAKVSADGAREATKREQKDDNTSNN